MNVRSFFKVIGFAVILSVFFMPIGSRAQDDFKQCQKIPYIKYSVDKTRLVLAINHHTGWGYRMLKFRFPNRLVLDISFKEGFPTDFQPTEELPVFEKFEVPVNHVLTGTNAYIDTDGIRITVSSNYSLKFEESYDKETNQLLITIPLQFKYEEKHYIRPGIEYRDIFIADETGPRKLHLIYVDLSSDRFVPTVITAQEFGHKFLTVKGLADNCGAVCAVNGGFFSSGGDHQGLIIRDGHLESYPNFDRPVFALTKDHKIHIGKLPFSGILLKASGASIAFDMIDTRPGSSDVVLLTPGHPARLSQNITGSKIVINDYKVEKVTTENVSEKKGRYILWSPTYREDFKTFKEGENVSLEFMLGLSNIEIECALGAGPMLIVDGEVNVDINGEYRNDIVKGRAPRTGIGVDKDGRLIMAVVEGRNPLGSIGCTLPEFANILKEYGAVLAINLDGGSSTALVIDGVKKSFNPGGSKGVTNALAIIDSRPINEEGIIY